MVTAEIRAVGDHLVTSDEFSKAAGEGKYGLIRSLSKAACRMKVEPHAAALTNEHREHRERPFSTAAKGHLCRSPAAPNLLLPVVHSRRYRGRVTKR